MLCDGQPVRACLSLALDCADRRIEGLGDASVMQALQRAFIAAGAFQFRSRRATSDCEPWIGPPNLLWFWAALRQIYAINAAPRPAFALCVSPATRARRCGHSDAVNATRTTSFSLGLASRSTTIVARACDRSEPCHCRAFPTFMARSRNLRRMILPVAVIGRLSTNSTARGYW